MPDEQKRRERDEQIFFLQQKLDTHIDNYNSHREDEIKRWGQFMDAQEMNTSSITALTNSTADLVSAWTAADGAVRSMSAIGSVVKWLSGFAFIGVMINWVMENIR